MRSPRADGPNPLLDGILARRSIRPPRLLPPGPDAAEIRTIAAAGLCAPDHGRLRPWRLVHVTDRERLAEAFAAAKQELWPEADAQAIERTKERATAGATLLLLIACIDPDHPTVPAHEQWIAVGAALANMLLAAEALGYRASFLSGSKTGTQSLRRAFDVAQHEHVAGFLTLGSAAETPAPRPAMDPANVFSEWP